MNKFSELLNGLVSIVISAVFILLGLRFILRLFAANPDNGFVNWIYQTSSEVLAPFRGIFPNENLDGFVFDFTALFAMLVYGLVGMFFSYAIIALTPSDGKSKR